jgi:hypothetical protein
MQNMPCFTILKSERDLVIYGPASVEVVDKEKDLIRMQAIKEAIPQLMKRGRLSIAHSDTIVGEILPEYNSNGKTYKTGVYGDSFYVVGKIWNDTQISQETRQKILSGEYNSYSISGTALEVQQKNNYTDITDVDLSAVTICAQGMNPYAKFDVIAKSQDKTNEVTKMPETEKTPQDTTPPARDVSKEFDEYKKSSDAKIEAISKQLDEITKSLAALATKKAEEKPEKKPEDDKDEEDDKKCRKDELEMVAKEAAEKTVKALEKHFTTPKPADSGDNRPGKQLSKSLAGKDVNETIRNLAKMNPRDFLGEDA